MTKRTTKPANGLTVEEKTVKAKQVVIFWIVIGLLVLASLPFWLPKYIKWLDNNETRRKDTETVIANCKGGKDVGSEILSYDTYYDNGNQEVPICRLPKNEVEKKAMYERKAYQQGLQDGSIDPEGNTADEQCSGNVCW